MSTINFSFFTSLSPAHLVMLFTSAVSMEAHYREITPPDKP
ncbi:hypothetical protein EDWATA_00517 [Edwardsiella tarda ATCC 23685]|uniref:Uncharacterized protein n=1 Tax=Edwardsiella tarda ATCC 23685 TaxID=500638 RepID=D4F1D2_EDWTA|nr:hypothetical protein EDWATA_00517 [Edwardsiella tarda ATCC 23685]